MPWGSSSARVVVDRVVFAMIGVVAGGTACAKIPPLDGPVARRMLRIDRRWERRVLGAVGRIEEERRAEAPGVGRDQPAVRRGLVTRVRPHLHDVADVHDERIAARLDEVPLALVEYL